MFELTARTEKRGISEKGFQPGDTAPVRIASDGGADEVKLRFAGLPDGWAGEVLQTQATDYAGRSSEKWTRAGGGAEFWGYVAIPESAEPGKYEMSVDCELRGGGAVRTALMIDVLPRYRESANAEDAQSLGRIAWFQSDFMNGAGLPLPKPFTPVEKRGSALSLLGRRVTIGAFGLPSAVESFFDSSLRVSETARDVLARPMEFEVSGQTFLPAAPELDCGGESAEVVWESESADFCARAEGKLEFDGYYSLNIELTAKRDVGVPDTSLAAELAAPEYFMGLGLDGGKMPGRHEFRWDSRYNRDGFWAGSVWGGMKLRYRDRQFRKPDVNIYYSYKPILVPESWDNGGHGVIEVRNGGVAARTGYRSFARGDKMCFGIDFWFTPFKPIDFGSHWSDRYYHPEFGVTAAERLKKLGTNGANIVNYHHGTDLYPYINYPFYGEDELKRFVDGAHALGVRVKLYNTVREMTTMMCEYEIVRSLGHEILEECGQQDGPTLWQEDAKAWIAEHYGADLIPAWRQELTVGKYGGTFDASLLTNGQSRLCNYYIEGLRHLADSVGIDGIYVDDTAFDRVTMKRVARLFDRKPGARIDLHSWNHHDSRAGGTPSLYQYMELMPYLSSLWLGEGFDYFGVTPEFWLIEMSGIPFGLMADTLAGGGAPYLGMLFGEANRQGWCGESPEPLRKLWDDFGIEQSQMLGWWDERNPVSASDESVKVTSYVRPGRLLAVVGNFAPTDVEVSLNYKNIAELTRRAVGIEGIQSESELKPGDKLRLPAKQGIILIAEYSEK